ncbi:MAG: 50S ribosomal protein L13 [Candidatus Aenigmarchaeota archaeon]|nr:50S ribosomal protein L13 [Candidatus Aenigmarchaeota archaeon]
MIMETLVVDAENQIAGRLATVVAKEILKGRHVIVVNAEKAVISGSPEYTIETFRAKISRGDPYKGPFYPKVPDRMFRRIVRGMLPRKPKGKEAYGRLKVYVGIPPEIGVKPESIVSFVETSNTLEHKFMTLGEISAKIGGRKS